MGQARFMVYLWLFFNHAAMDWAWFMVYPLFFFYLYASRPKLSLGQILSHATCDVYSPKAVETLINLISDTDFRGKKIKNPAFVQNYIFSAEISLGTYTYLYSFELSMKWPFLDIFPSGSTKTSDYKITPNPHIAKKSLQNPAFEAIYHFSVNSYHTLADGKSIP